jgi:hypothetical protein
LGRGLIALDVESVGVTEAANARHEDSLPCVDLRPSARHHGRSAGHYQPALAQLGHDVAGPRESSAATVIVFITA